MTWMGVTLFYKVSKKFSKLSTKTKYPIAVNQTGSRVLTVERYEKRRIRRAMRLLWGNFETKASEVFMLIPRLQSLERGSTSPNPNLPCERRLVEEHLQKMRAELARTGTQTLQTSLNTEVQIAAQ